MEKLELFKEIAKNIIIGKVHKFNQTMINNQENIIIIEELEKEEYLKINKCETREIDNKIVTIINGYVTDKGIDFIKENKLETYKI